ncbi:hypothetical protein K6119_00790 [Paracrocinitomix mangrovi]|uniref:hypothetical protein n=1 Tax=Paracrocinitomix mangrovi TaxID=2862509 RepID=UPI001ED9E83B|nr:hypothetical protein [Paracrocinitomix mangrovi]UKN02050.1 hypothetical protein K6119_00790 [Paracrocinitomix mangrovi]
MIRSYKYILVILILFFAAKPALKLCFHILDVKQELCEFEGEEEEDVEESELDDLEEESDKLFAYNIEHLSRLEERNESFFHGLIPDYQAFDPGVVLPPPELA